ncbi:MAG: response regulator [Campylobacterales bacterium]|nr:response regulator [Campylobacterales bacterium]
MELNNKNIRILYVDDSSTVREMVETFLYELGYFNIQGAEDGMEALEICEHDEFDFIITDINMPNMDGITLISKLRKKLDYATIPIMVLTTEYSKEMKQKGKKAGATSWIVKPFDLQLLNKAIKQTLQRVYDQQP